MSVSTSSRRRFGVVQRSPVALLVVVALVIGVGWLLGWSSVLAVSDVEVRGGSPSVQRAVRSAVRRSGAADTGTPLARVDTSAVQRQVARLVAVESVRVSRGWPHTVVVEVVERRPAAALEVSAGYQLVAADGTAFRRVTRRPPGLPLLKAVAGPQGRAARSAAVAAVTALPRSLRTAVTTVRADSPDAISFRLHGVTVVWGDAEHNERKAQVLAALMAQKADVYDVSAPDLPTTRGSG